jgi:hypothetical protein
MTALVWFTMSILCAPATAGESEAARLQTAIDQLDVMQSLLDGGKINEATRRELLAKVISVRDEVAGVQGDLLRSTATVTVGGPGGLGLSMSVETHEGASAEVLVHDPLGGPMALEEPPPLPPLPMGAGPFAALIDAVEAESFGDEKVAVLRQAAANNLFSVAQVRQLLPLYTFSDEKIEAAVALYPRTIDAENWFQVYQEFTFDSDKDELRDRLGL